MVKRGSKEQAAAVIGTNRKARHDYEVLRTFSAGLVLHGWEVKSLRAGRIQLRESYVLIKGGEAWLLGAHFSPLPTASTHVSPDPLRTRKLLLTRKELNVLIGGVQRKGLTVVPLMLMWQGKYIKARIALAKGKKQYDKRQDQKQKEWDRDKRRALKSAR